MTHPMRHSGAGFKPRQSGSRAWALSYTLYWLYEEMGDFQRKLARVLLGKGRGTWRLQKASWRK